MKIKKEEFCFYFYDETEARACEINLFKCSDLFSVYKKKKEKEN